MIYNGTEIEQELRPITEPCGTPNEISGTGLEPCQIEHLAHGVCM